MAMFFLLEKKNENKLALFRAILFKGAWENITLTQLQGQLSISQVSIRHLIKEINDELKSKVSIEIKNNEVFLKKNELVVEQIIHFYSINDNGYKILEVLFMKPKVYTVESLAQHLYISTSHLYKVIKKFNDQLMPYNIFISIKNGIYLNGPEQLIKNLFYEFLSLSNRSYEQLTFSPSESALNRQVHIIFAEYGILTDYATVTLFSHWIVTCLNFKYLLNKKSIVITDEKMSENFPFHIEEEFFVIGESVLKSFGMQKITKKEVMGLYLGLASLALSFATKQEAEDFRRNFIKKSAVKKKVENLYPLLLDMIDNQRELKKMTVSLEFFIEFILTYTDYFLITWKNYLDLYHFVYKSSNINYETIKKLCAEHLEIDHAIKQEVYVQLFCLMIDFYNQNTGTKINNKKFIYKSILGLKTETLMANKLMSLFEDPLDESSLNTDYVYIVDDIRLMKDATKKYMLLTDFVDYINRLF